MEGCKLEPKDEGIILLLSNGIRLQVHTVSKQDGRPKRPCCCDVQRNRRWAFPLARQLVAGLSVESRVLSWVRPRETCGRQSGNGSGFSPSNSNSPFSWCSVLLFHLNAALIRRTRRWSLRTLKGRVAVYVVGGALVESHFVFFSIYEAHSR